MDVPPNIINRSTTLYQTQKPTFKVIRTFAFSPQAFYHIYFVFNFYFFFYFFFYLYLEKKKGCGGEEEGGTQCFTRLFSPWKFYISPCFPPCKTSLSARRSRTPFFAVSFEKYANDSPCVIAKKWLQRNYISESYLRIGEMREKKEAEKIMRKEKQGVGCLLSCTKNS